MIFQASKNDIAWPIVPASFHFQSPVSFFLIDVASGKEDR